ncbi:MAG: endopeptidase La [Chloroflexi bacterium]|nr:endopeptidase La [Chloroflexota bacterium]
MSLEESESTERFPLLPLKNVVIFPRNIVTLLVGRARSIQAVEDALAGDRRVVVTAQRDIQQDEPQADHLYPVGTLGEIIQIERQQGGNVQVVLEGTTRVRLLHVSRDERLYQTTVVKLPETGGDTPEAAVLVPYVRELVSRYAESKGRLTTEVSDLVSRTEDAGQLADLLVTQLVTEMDERQRLLETTDVRTRLEAVAVRLSGELDVMSLEQRIKDRVREQIDKNQREYYLREQLKVIHDELSGEAGNEIAALRDAIKTKALGAESEAKMLKEVARLEKMPAISAEGTVVRTYIDWVLSLPWHECSDDRLDLIEAEAVLEADHYGLKEIKERILEFLAVRKLTQEQGRSGRTAILCFSGPPGVGKTSLGMSIARAMNRKFVRISLGGVRDEAEIRGHRRTYIGAMPGRLVQALKTAGTSNPVILLDEIDKMSSDYRGDPASAMLEVLDPEQNHAFVDHYIDLAFDLSNVLFITTANVLWNIPKPLRDRMEVIELDGYTELEKIEIARRHLLPKQLAAHGLAANHVEITDRLLYQIIRGHTREAGVRNLERQLATICRKAASLVVRGKSQRVRLTPHRLTEFLGNPRYGFEERFGTNQIGVAIGLSWTEYGGEVLPIEVVTMPGRGALTITGRLGDVMQESAKAALSYARSRSAQFHIEREFQDKVDLHIHVPEGAIPKDGPSAGISIATALISALTRRPVRHDVAMTGEITLRGRVLPIGGLREKVLAAHRTGVRRVIAPADNRRDLTAIPREVAREMHFYWVEDMDQVVAEALEASSDGDRAGPPAAGSTADQSVTEMADVLSGAPPAVDLGAGL